MSKLSDDKISKIINLYKEGFSYKEIGDKVGIHDNSVARILRRNGVSRNRSVEIPDDKVKKIIDMYLSGISSEIIGKNLDINGSTVCRILKKNNIKIRPATENKRIYNINETFFEKIDSQEKAYFLGLLYADGSIKSSKSSSVRLVLHPKDKDILIKFSNAIYGFQKIGVFSKNNNTDYLGVAVYSKKMVNDLCSLGCIPNKSFSITFPKNIPNNLKNHFIRGYFDGDGCLSMADKYKTVVDITSTKEFLEGLIQFLNDELDFGSITIQQRHKDRDTNTRNIQIMDTKRIKLFLDYIYKDASVYLDRKYKLYMNFLEKLSNKTRVKFDKISNNIFYGTTYIPIIEGNRITSKYLESLTLDEKEILADELVKFYRENGFPYPKLSDDELIQQFSLIKNINMNNVVKDGYLTIFNNTGSKVIKHFSHHFFEIESAYSNKFSAFKTFSDDNLLKKVILNRLNRNYSLSGNMIRQGLMNSNIAFRASFFNVSIAKYIYSKYVPENGVIYDYSMGFGQRLLAALSLPYKIKYIGVDPLERSVKSNQNIYDFYNKNIPMLNKNCELICTGSEYFTTNEKIDFAFSSPPYYNLEIYENNPSQAYNRSYADFINVWWRDVVSNIDGILNTNGIFAINIKPMLNAFNIAEDMVNVAVERGFKIINTEYIQLTKNIAFKNKKNEYKYEPIFILKK